MSLDKYREIVDGRRGRCRDSFCQLGNSQPRECDKVTLLWSSHQELTGGNRSCREACPKLKLLSLVNS